MPFDSDRWDSVDADVRIKAGTIRRPEAAAAEHLSTRIQMKDKVLTLNPLEFGIAGGKFAGTVTLDGQQGADPGGPANAACRSSQLRQALSDDPEQGKASVGDIGGLIELTGRGDSVAQMLGALERQDRLLHGRRQDQQFMMELVAMDVWGVAKVKLQGDEPVDIRCAIADFGVKDGVMNTNAFVFDTAMVNVEGGGTINLKNEQMDLKLNPRPKDSSVASLNSAALRRAVPSASPSSLPDVKRLGAKGVGAVLMGIINPLLAVLPLVKEGKGKDSPCNQLMAEATKLKKEAAPGAARRPRRGAALRRLLQTDQLHQARQRRVLLRDQLAELRRRQEGGPHAEVLGALLRIRATPTVRRIASSRLRSRRAACRAARRCRARLRARRRCLARAPSARPASAGSRFRISAASRRTWPCFTGADSAAGSCTTASTWPPSRLGTTCAAPNGTSFTSTPAALKSATSEMMRVAADAGVADADRLRLRSSPRR